MKPRLLICTIARDAAPHLDTWKQQLIMLYHYVKAEYDVEVSVYENDSVDDTAGWIDTWLDSDLRPGVKVTMRSETLGTQRYGSVWSLDRLRNLALARQKCLDQVGPLDRFSKVCYIEPDVTYDPHWCAELILARHPRAAGLGEPDIYSGWSLRTEANPKESVFLYDTCATRATKDDLTWDITERGGKWRGETVIPTDLGGYDAMCLHPVWSTFNAFCVYNAEPFKLAQKHGYPPLWGWVNHRLNTGQQYIDDGDYGSGWLDADSAVVCEAFRARGYNKVFLNTNALIRHS